MTRAGRRWTQELDRSLHRLGRMRAVLMVLGATLMGLFLTAMAVSVLADISTGTLDWGDAVGSGRRTLPAAIVIGVGGPCAVLCVLYAVSLAVRLVLRWRDAPPHGSRRPSR